MTFHPNRQGISDLIHSTTRESAESTTPCWPVRGWTEGAAEADGTIELGESMRQWCTADGSDNRPAADVPLAASPGRRDLGAGVLGSATRPRVASCSSQYDRSRAGLV
jgi:hypothetical protein